jgi:adenine deaminase
VIERHTGSGRIQVGLVQGFGLNVPCAVGTTVAHDCHQLIVAGTDEGCMAKAANFLAEIGGGQVVVLNNEIIGKVSLPIGGLMSDRPAKIVADEAASILAGFKRCGCQMNNPNMQLSLLALVVIPSLRISDQGLVDVNHFSFVPVLE